MFRFPLKQSGCYVKWACCRVELCVMEWAQVCECMPSCFGDVYEPVGIPGPGNAMLQQRCVCERQTNQVQVQVQGRRLLPH
jgi:hypothetical protein